MKTSKAPKIVIGVGLLAVYAAILSTVILRDRHAGAVTPATSNMTESFNATDPPASAGIDAPPTDPANTFDELPVATPPPIAPAIEGQEIARTAPAPVNTPNASGPGSASIADEAPPVAPVAATGEAPADTDTESQTAVDNSDEDVAPLVVGN